MVSFNRATCVCPEGFKGRHCEFRTNPGSQSPVINHAYRWKRYNKGVSFGYTVNVSAYQTISKNNNTELNTVRNCQKICEQMGSQACKSIVFRSQGNICGVSNITLYTRPQLMILKPTIKEIYMDYTLRDCGSFYCLRTCNYGYLKDNDGCFHCECRPDPCRINSCQPNEDCRTYKVQIDINNTFIVAYHKCVPNTCPKCNNTCSNGYFPFQALAWKTGKQCPQCRCAYLLCPGYMVYDRVVSCTTLPCSSPHTCQLRQRPGVCPTDLDKPEYGSTCYTDKNCKNIEKCCATSKGMSCVAPLIKGNSSCPLKLRESLINNSLLIPRCSDKGDYMQIQCYSKDAVMRCYCVDTVYGQQLTEEVITDTANISCASLDPYCPRMPERCLMKQCPYGNVLDKMGCPTCRCIKRDRVTDTNVPLENNAR